MAQNFGTQPDSAAVAYPIRGTASELEKHSNLPAIHQGDTTVNMNQTIEARLLAQIQTQSAQLQALSVEVQALSIRLLVSEHNNTARLQNRMLFSFDAQLMSLYDMDNNLINPFPANSTALQQLSEPQISELLVALNVSTDGTVEEKMMRLRIAIGLRDAPSP